MLSQNNASETTLPVLERTSEQLHEYRSSSFFFSFSNAELSAPTVMERESDDGACGDREHQRTSGAGEAQL